MFKKKKKQNDARRSIAGVSILSHVCLQVAERREATPLLSVLTREHLTGCSLTLPWGEKKKKRLEPEPDYQEEKQDGD